MSFYRNFLVLSAQKCHFFTLGNGSNLFKFVFDNVIFKNSLSGKTLGLIIDHNPDFSDHISNECKTAIQNLSPISFIACFLDVLQSKKI